MCCAPACSGMTRARFAEAAELDAQPIFRHLTGNIVFPGFTAPKVLWVARHEPAIFARDGQGSLAEGLSAALADRRICVGNVGCGGHFLAGCRQAGLGCVAAGGDRAEPFAHAVAGGRHGSQRILTQRSGGALGHERQCRGRGRRGRQCGLGLRHGHRRAGNGLCVAWHIRRAVCLE